MPCRKAGQAHQSHHHNAPKARITSVRFANANNKVCHQAMNLIIVMPKDYLGLALGNDFELPLL